MKWGYGNYNKAPNTEVCGYNAQAFRGYDEITAAIDDKLKHCSSKAPVVTVECYPGVNDSEVLTALKKGLKPTLVIHSDEASFDGQTITKMIEHNLTEDRVFGILWHGEMEEFFDQVKLDELRQRISECKSGTILVYGTGASLVALGDVTVYADMARWEIQLRYRRKEQCNWKMKNFDEDMLRKYKRGYFVEWRLADRLKKKLLYKMDFLLDTNVYDDPKMVTREAFFAGLEQTVSQPFRVVPYFDPGVWGGQWMKQVCGLDKNQANFAWCFDGVPEENSLYLRYGEVQLEIPSLDLVFCYPKELLGDKVHARFGTEFPIRFDFLDTMGGQNLSLQVHPLTEYIQDEFGMNYTQDESYYILDADPGAIVYLGVKESVNSSEMVEDLKRANRGDISFPDTKYVNQFPAKKHDHFLIPAGTVHCSGAGSMVLEISATPYIFTFKLWDWDRLGLDGLPRPVHIEHGAKNIQFNRDTKWVEQNLVGQVEIISQEQGWCEERTGLHRREFIETRRHWFNRTITVNTHGGVNVLNLVEGKEAVISSPEGKFSPYTVHYAETFIVPAGVEEYQVAPCQGCEGSTLGLIQAFVRT